MHDNFEVVFMGSVIAGLAVLLFGLSLLPAVIQALPLSPFAVWLADWATFCQSESVSQGLSWLAWFFPVSSILALIPAISNGILAYYGAFVFCHIVGIL